MERRKPASRRLGTLCLGGSYVRESCIAKTGRSRGSTGPVGTSSVPACCLQQVANAPSLLFDVFDTFLVGNSDSEALLFIRIYFVSFTPRLRRSSSSSLSGCSAPTAMNMRAKPPLQTRRLPYRPPRSVTGDAANRTCEGTSQQSVHGCHTCVFCTEKTALACLPQFNEQGVSGVTTVIIARTMRRGGSGG